MLCIICWIVGRIRICEYLKQSVVGGSWVGSEVGVFVPCSCKYMVLWQCNLGL